MSAETDIIAAFVASPAIAPHGVFLNAADETTPLPYIVVTATHDRELLLDSSLDSDHVTFTIACWATGAAVAEGLADSASAVLDADDDYAILARTGGFDQETGNDVAVITADRWLTA